MTFLLHIPSSIAEWVLCAILLQIPVLVFSVTATLWAKRGRALLTTAPEHLAPTPSVGHSRASVLIIGGSGRLGLAAARFLVRRSLREATTSLTVKLGSRNLARGAVAVASLEKSAPNGLDLKVEFVALDICDSFSIESAMAGCDLVVHCAGPYAGDAPKVLRAAIACGVDYIDICDDNEYAKESLMLSSRATDAGICGLICTGIQPGFSSLMGAECVARLGGPGSVARVDYDYHVSGTGGSGPAILASTFMLCAEPVYTYEGGAEVTRRAASGERWTNFGTGVGSHFCMLLPVPEIRSCHVALDVPSVEVRFGTAPHIFNRANQLMSLLPKTVLLNRSLMMRYARMLLPLCRAVDYFVGATTAMRVCATSKNGTRRCVMRYAHDDMVECIGTSVATFAWALIQRRRRGTLKAGVYYPEQLFADCAERVEFFAKAKHGAFLFDCVVESNV